MYRIKIIVFVVHIKDKFRFGLGDKFAHLGKLDERTKSSLSEIEGGRKALANLGDEMIAVWDACAIGKRVPDEHEVDGLSPDPFRVVETPLVGLELGKRPRPLPTHDCRQIGHLPQRENSLATGQINPAIWLTGETGRRDLNCERLSARRFGLGEPPMLFDVLI